MEDSLACSLAAAGLAAEGGGRVNSCLMPLGMFNGATEMACHLLQAPELVPTLTGHASVCLDHILNKMADKVRFQLAFLS